MGAETYTWVTKYKKNLADALATARMEVFAAGKFIGAEEHPASIEEAVELGAECGTGSLLDIVSVNEASGLCSVCPVSKEECVEFFGTERPTFAEIEKCMPFWESFDRGEARAVTLYENGKPAQICFAGWTIDAPSAGSGSFEDAKGKKKPKKAEAKPKPEFGLWVKPVESTQSGFPVFVKMSYGIGELMGYSDPPDHEILSVLLFTEIPIRIKCVPLRMALCQLLKMTVNGFYRYTVKSKSIANSGSERIMNFPMLDDPAHPRAAIIEGHIGICRMTLCDLEPNNPTGYKTVRQEVVNVSGKKEIQLGNQTALICKKKINPLFDRDELLALTEKLAGINDDTELEYMLGDITMDGGETIIKEKVSITSSIPAEERATDLEFFKSFLKRHKEAVDAGETSKLREEQNKAVLIFIKYQNDMEFLQQVLTIPTDIVAQVLSRGKKP